MAMVFVSAGGADAARHGVIHISGAWARGAFSTCGAVHDGDRCSVTLVYIANDRPATASADAPGPCLWLEHIEGYRSGHLGIRTISDRFATGCGAVRVTIPRSLDAAHVVGATQTQTCIWGTPDPCTDSGPITVDLTWRATATVQRFAPLTVRSPDDDTGLICLHHEGPLTIRTATLSGSIPEFGPLGSIVPDSGSIWRSGSTFVGEEVADCPD
jgi:hypothetical protein